MTEFLTHLTNLWVILQVIDARATMAIYRIHKKEWDKDLLPLPVALNSKKRKASDEQEDTPVKETGDTDASQKPFKKFKAARQFPGGGQKGVSSGLSTIVKRSGQHPKRGASQSTGNEPKEKWWATLNPTLSKGAKGSIRIPSTR